MSVFSIETLRALYTHMEWADATVWRVALAHAPAATDEKLRGWLLHIHVVQRAFLDVWKGERPLIPAPSEFQDLAAVHRWGRSVYADGQRFLQTVPADTLERPLALPWVEEFEQHLGRSFDTPTLAETIFQVTSHSTYHRGQVNARLRELGGEPPLVDFIAWVWFGRPVVSI